MLRIKSFIAVYFALTVLYFAQSSIFGENSGVGLILILPILAVNAFYIGRYILDTKKTNFLNANLAFILLNLVYYLIDRLFLHNIVPEMSFSFLKNVLLALTYSFTLYYWGLKGIDIKWILISYATIVALFGIYTFGNENIEYLNQQMQSNIGYIFVTLLPYVFLLNKHKLLMLPAAFMLNILVVMSAKRGAIVCTGLFDLLFIYYLINVRGGKYELLKKLFIILSLIYGLWMLYEFISNDLFLLQRFNDLNKGNSSGRDIIYGAIINAWTNKYDWYQIIFGQGFCATPLITGSLFAHNDWLELLADMGLLGIIFYFVFIVALFKTAIRYRGALNVKLMLLSVAILWFAQTLFSMSYMDQDSYKYLILVGYFSGFRMHSGKRIN